MLTEFQIAAAEVSARELFEGKHFSICELDKLIKLVGCIPDQKDYQALQCLHCIDWAAMSPRLRAMVTETVIRILQQPGFDTEIIGERLLINAQSELSH